MRYLILLIFLSSCTTERLITKYIDREIHDTTIIQKDKIVVDRITDSIYSWIYDTTIVEYERVRKVLQPCADSIVKINKVVYTELYKDQFHEAEQKLKKLEQNKRWWQKGALLTWGWIGLLILVIIAIKRR
jgi:hypothetical protein